MASKNRKLDRRQFLVLVGGVAATGAMGGLYFVSDCPISADGRCTGPCAACYDANGNALCDRIETAPVPSEPEAAGVDSFVPACPFGLRYDPYPGKCLDYVDSSGSGYCDYSEPQTATAGSTPAATAAATATATAAASSTAAPGATPVPTVACPFGLVNDPFPGRCGRYCDVNSNALCDLSEPGFSDESSAADVPAAPLPTTTAVPTRAEAVDTSVVGPVACPLGELWDPYPGKCRSYVDTNSNGYCDYSEPAFYEQLSESASGNRRGRGGN